MESLDLIDLVYGDEHGYVFIVSDDFQVSRAFQWPEKRSIVKKYIDTISFDDVYFTVSLFNKDVRHQEWASTTNVVYADADTCHPDNFRVRPSIIVETSPGRWHVYWLLDTAVSAQKASEMSRIIAHAHKHEGCDNGWILTKLLRVPGTQNTKYETNNTVKGETTGEVYTLEELHEAYSDVQLPSEKEVVSTSVPLNLPALPQCIDYIDTPTLYDLFKVEPKADQDWSVRLLKLETELFRKGCSREVVYVLASQARCNKFKRDGRPAEHLWRHVITTEANTTADSEILFDDQPKKVQQAVDLLSGAERTEALKAGSVVEKYVNYALTRSKDSSPQYHYSLFFALLSATLGDLAFVKPQFGPISLNFWLMILGDTTRTRKSYSVKHMLNILHKFEAITGDRVDLASDVTSEGLNKVLEDRDGRVTLMNVDEAQGLFKATKSKAYLADLLDSLNKLYDGTVPQRIRSGTVVDPSKPRVNTIFNLLTTGIEEQVTSGLTREDYLSGFVPRTVMAIGRPQPWTPESERVEQAVDGLEVDLEATAWAEKLASTRAFWQGIRARKARGKRFWLRFTDDAWERWNQLRVDTFKLLDKHRDNKFLEPSRERLMITVLKTSALLALFDKSEEVTLNHLLVSIWQCERWLKDNISFVEQLTSTAYQRKLAELESEITKQNNHKETLQALYQRFGRKSEVDSMLDDLHYQGRVRVNLLTQEAEAIVL